jgi:hypothetical protein
MTGRRLLLIVDERCWLSVVDGSAVREKKDKRGWSVRSFLSSMATPIILIIEALIRCGQMYIVTLCVCVCVCV